MNGEYFRGKAAIVTGASQGIGRATAILLARAGARVTLAARNQAALEETAALAGGETLVIPTDVSVQEQVEAMVARTIERFGQVDILVGNAGQYIRCPALELEAKTIQRAMEVNFYGQMYAILAVLPHMARRRSGHIVIVSSMDGKKGLPLDAPYVAAKFALNGFGEVLRQELGPLGIRVSLILPGRVDTEMIKHLRFHWISKPISAESVARAILNAIRRGKAEVIVPPQARLLYYVNVIHPRLGDLSVRLFHLEGWEVKPAVDE